LYRMVVGRLRKAQHAALWLEKTFTSSFPRKIRRQQQ
jgi:hypothetical protein